MILCSGYYCSVSFRLVFVRLLFDCLVGLWWLVDLFALVMWFAVWGVSCGGLCITCWVSG